MKKLVLKKFFIIISVMLCLCVFSIDNVLAFWSELPGGIEKRVKNNHQFSSEKSKKEKIGEFKKVLYDFEGLEDELSPKKITYIGTGLLPIIKKEKAVEDVKFLIKLMKYGYAGYQYFGGDNRFLQARKHIISEINECNSVFSYITFQSFKSILHDNLSFIQDGHFSLGKRSLLDKKGCYINTQYKFNRSDRGFYTYMNGNKIFLKSINNKNPEKFMKLTLDEEGKVIYSPGKLMGIKDDHHLVLEFEKKIKNLERKINLTRISDSNTISSTSSTAFNLKYIDDIPVIQCRSFSPSSDKQREKLKAFVKSGTELRDEEFLIIDLRGNSGGNEVYVNKWIENYTGQEDVYSHISCSLATKTAIKLFENTLKIYNDTDYKKNHLEMFKVKENGWSEINYHQVDKINNKGMIIVLTDNNVLSGGECFVEYLRNFENVIFMGANTGGGRIFGNIGSCLLPNSRIRVVMGRSIFLPLDLKNREGSGYVPDIWVNPKRLPELAVKFINNYWKQ